MTSFMFGGGRMDRPPIRAQADAWSKPDELAGHGVQALVPGSVVCLSASSVSRTCAPSGPVTAIWAITPVTFGKLEPSTGPGISHRGSLWATALF
jgi:hypothetical protein